MGELNNFELSDFIKQYNLNTFIETGTGKGFGLSYAATYPFTKLYSIEIMEELYRDNIKRFKNDSRIKLVFNNSIDGLLYILNNLFSNARILFWLDAHFPGVDFQLKSYNSSLEKHINTPLETELNTIFSVRKNNKDIYIIDDLRLYEDGDYELGALEDREKYGYKNIDFAIDLFSKTHDVTRSYKQQGFLIAEPKSE